MSGHSKWANIKRKKARMDAQRGKVFTRLAREIIVAARMGGGDPEANPRLKAAVQRAKEANIPNENIQRAIQRGVGGAGGADYEEVFYEGYGPGGVAFMLRILTDNRNRTAGEIRYLFSKNGGSLGEAGCVSWMFRRKGLFLVDKEEFSDEDSLLLAALEAGAEDVKVEEDSFEVVTAPEDFENVRDALTRCGIPVADAQITMVPVSTVKVKEEESGQLLRLLEVLEDHDDVQEVYTNYEPA
ncbi:MAG: YebC/PmpR family DNA-binding transcriptional regulator [Desulfotomaculales bacterium]